MSVPPFCRAGADELINKFNAVDKGREVLWVCAPPFWSVGQIKMRS